VFAKLLLVVLALGAELAIVVVVVAALVLVVGSADSFHSFFDFLIRDRKLEALHTSAED
jgi:hypothetical protein